jgi:hypothetical protein
MQDAAIPTLAISHPDIHANTSIYYMQFPTKLQIWIHPTPRDAKFTVTYGHLDRSFRRSRGTTCSRGTIYPVRSCPVRRVLIHLADFLLCLPQILLVSLDI